ncbi:MAG: ferritin [Prevotellaceae bacterium]|nr:ferritin [Prevotellaceae bacterium]
MISSKLQDAINAQIGAEMWSANLYLSMSYYFGAKGYEGFAKWMKAQANEENEHAEEMAQYLMKRGGQAKVGALEAVPQEWESPLAVFEHVYQHECHVSQLIDALVDVAAAENDKASQDFLWGFVREQVEEEATAQGIVDKMKLGGASALYHLNAELGTRK